MESTEGGRRGREGVVATRVVLCCDAFSTHSHR
jgi:hypothetical protein